MFKKLVTWKLYISAQFFINTRYSATPQKRTLKIRISQKFNLNFELEHLERNSRISGIHFFFEVL